MWKSSEAKTVESASRSNTRPSTLAAIAPGADVIAMATRGRSLLGRALLGAVAHKVVRTAPGASNDVSL